MKGRHGTRMVQVITADWMLQIILDEPPEALEKQWRNDRIMYYKRLEPTEAPRDKSPYLPPDAKRHKAIRLEGEAANRMWELLLKDDEINELKESAEQARIMQQAMTAKGDALPTADEITDDLLKVHLSDKFMDGNRVVNAKVWLDTKGPGLKGHGQFMD